MILLSHRYTLGNHEVPIRPPYVKDRSVLNTASIFSLNIHHIPNRRPDHHFTGTENEAERISVTCSRTHRQGRIMQGQGQSFFCCCYWLHFIGWLIWLHPVLAAARGFFVVSCRFFGVTRELTAVAWRPRSTPASAVVSLGLSCSWITGS